MPPFTVDKYLDPYVPRSIVPRLPVYIGRFLGGGSTPKPLPDYVLWLDILIGSFASILTIEAVFMHSGVFKEHHAPIIIAPYGATAILMFNCNTAPLAQPRNVFFGPFISSLVGVIIQKLFFLSEAGAEYYYIGGALSVGIASVAMLIFNCVHPPSGASALIPVVDAQIRSMGWWYIPAHIISSVLIIGVACVTNNVLRKYPTHWWTAYTKPEPQSDVEKQEPVSQEPEKEMESRETSMERKIVISGEDVEVPSDLELTADELEVLKSIKSKLGAYN